MNALPVDGLFLGTYLTVPHPGLLPALAAAGLDFVRIDAFRAGWNDADLSTCVAAARAAKLVPWARALDDASGQIQRMVALGAEIVTVPGVDSPGQARRIVRSVDEAAKRHDRGDVLVGVQVESAEGLAACRDIVAVEGVDIVHTGRTDLARSLGASNQFDPRVLAAERNVVETAQAAGKRVSLLFPIDARGRRMSAEWVSRGVRTFALGTDVQVLQTALGSEARRLRARAAAQTS